MDENTARKTVLDNTLTVEFPAGFSEMTGDDIKKYFSGDMRRFGLRNAEEHIILSVGKTNDSFMSLLTDAKSFIAGAENSLKKNLKDYQCTDRFDTELLGKATKGIRFSYSASDTGTGQFCEMTVVKIKRCFYVVYCMSRLEDAERTSSLFTSFRDSIKLA